jgi:glutathione reductase (NADPH)
MSREHDLIVLGGGSGGIAAALRAASHGADVALLEPNLLGGTCVNVGCVPKKATWFAADLAHAQALAHEYGFELTPGALDWSRFIAARDDYIAASRASYARRLEAAGVKLIARRGRLIAPGRVRAGFDLLAAAHVLIATGARPRRATFDGGNLGIDSDGFFALRAAPRHIAIVGGGYVAVELAGALRALGSRVCLFARGDSLLSRDVDPDVAAVLREAMLADGINASVCSEVVEVRRDGDDYTLRCVGDHLHAGYDQVLWAIGRIPNVEGIGLESAGIALDSHGAIAVDAQQNCNVAGHYALGDVTSNPAFTPYAVRTGRALADRLFGGRHDAHYAPMAFPSVAFSHPPVGAMGLSEGEARARHGSAVTCYSARFVPMRMKLAKHDRPTVMKLVCVGDDQRIVGLHLCGDGAEEMLQGFAVAVTMGATKADFDATLAIHPTSSEEFVLMTHAT